jgi:hypothetical protein
VADAVYTVGAAIAVSFTNETARTLELGSLQCGMFVQARREVDGSWVTVTPPDSVCTLQLRYLLPGESAQTMFRTDPGLPPGVYRLGAPLPTPDAGVATETVYSPPFQLKAPSLP